MKRIILLLFVALFIRVVPACLFFGSYDSVQAKNVYSFIKEGGVDNLGRQYNDFPHFFLFPWLSYLIGFFSERTGIPYQILFKLPAICADLAITFLIYKAFLNLGSAAKGALNAAALYALNPVAIMLSSINGQFDSLAALFCLAAWYFWRFGRGARSAVCLGIAVLIKEFPAMLLPAFWGRRR